MKRKNGTKINQESFCEFIFDLTEMKSLKDTCSHFNYSKSGILKFTKNNYKSNYKSKEINKINNLIIKNFTIKNFKDLIQNIKDKRNIFSIYKFKKGIEYLDFVVEIIEDVYNKGIESIKNFIEDNLNLQMLSKNYEGYNNFNNIEDTFFQNKIIKLKKKFDEKEEIKIIKKKKKEKYKIYKKKIRKEMEIFTEKIRIFFKKKFNIKDFYTSKELFLEIINDVYKIDFNEKELKYLNFINIKKFFKNKEVDMYKEPKLVLLKILFFVLLLLSVIKKDFFLLLIELFNFNFMVLFILDILTKIKINIISIYINQKGILKNLKLDIIKILFLKNKFFISNNDYQFLRNYNKIFSLLLPTLNEIKLLKKIIKFSIFKKFQIKNIPIVKVDDININLNGFYLNPQKISKTVLKLNKKEKDYSNEKNCETKINDTKNIFKISTDNYNNYNITSINQLNNNIFNNKSGNYVFYILIFPGAENAKNYSILKDLMKFDFSSLKIGKNKEEHQVKFYFISDLKSFKCTIPDLKNFCLFCNLSLFFF
jgi:hypothetical protein